MKYTINSKKCTNGFTVPDVIVDKHLRLASGEQIKVLLLILRKSPDALDEKAIAKALKFDVSDVEDYLQYWVLTGILNEADETEPSLPEPEKYIPKAQKVKEEQVTVTVPVTAPEPEKPAYSKPSSAEIAARMSESKEIANLFNELQVKLGRTIGYDGQCTFMLLLDRFGLPVDVIFMLVDYCVSIGKIGFNYIESVGRSWGEQEIDTIAKAAEKIDSLNKIDKFWKRFIEETGIKNPKPTAKQIEYIGVWLNQLKTKPEMIIRAYEEMAENTGKLSFSYMDKIIRRWASEGIRNSDDINREKADHKDAKKAKSASPADASYDLDSYRNKAINQKLKYERKST